MGCMHSRIRVDGITQEPTSNYAQKDAWRTAAANDQVRKNLLPGILKVPGCTVMEI